MILNLGCGDDYHQGWVNIDLFGEVDFIHDLNKPLPVLNFPNDSADAIFCNQVIEHLQFKNIPAVLASWYRVLKPNGLLVIETPNLRKVLKMIQESEFEDTEVMEWLFGNQDHPGQTHFWGYTPESLTELLEDANFVGIEIKESEDNFRSSGYSFRIECRKGVDK